MRIYSLSSGRVLFEDGFSSLKKTAENAAVQGADLSFADFRKADFRSATLDGIIAPGACFWGADLSGAALAQSNLKGCDMRLAMLARTCLAESICDESDFRGATFSSTLLAGASLKNCRFSGAGILRQDMAGIESLAGSAYDYLGETLCPMTRPPVYVRGLGTDIVFLDAQVMVGTKLYNRAALPPDFAPLAQVIDKLRNTTLRYCNAANIFSKKL